MSYPALLRLLIRRAIATSAPRIMLMDKTRMVFFIG